MRLRAMFTAALTGALIVGSVWAGAALTPVDRLTEGKSGLETAPRALSAADVGSNGDLGGDEALVGAAKISIEPAPDESKGEVWVRDAAACLPLTSADAQGTLDHAADWRNTWIENNNCIYMGGFGIGPSQPVLAWDKETDDPVIDPATGAFNENGYGLWTRSAAISRGGQTLILTILDGEGYFGSYRRMCGATPCGAFDIAKQLTEEFTASRPELGIEPGSFVFASTHSHAAMDFIGGWGGVPQWYMDQVANAMRDSVRRAVESMEPAALEAGQTLARGLNSERRDTYRSAEDATVDWIRAVDADGNVITTIGTFAAHATSFGSDETVAHADWPGVFDKAVEKRFGGIGLMFEAGLGNMSARGNNHGSMGNDLANLLPPVGGGTLVTSPNVRVKQEFWDQPITNTPLNALGTGGFFDRDFQSVPASVSVGKSDAKPCRSASPVSVRVAATAAKIGNVVVTAGPGEIFANISNTIEEVSSIAALAIGQANDALGYMPQSFETDHASRQGPGFVGADVFEYEDAYSIDACFGDMFLETVLRNLATL